MISSSIVQDKTIIFLHIHKAAGSTLSMIIERQFPAHAVFPGSLSVHPTRRTIRILWGKRNSPHQIMAEFRALPENDKRQIKYLHHHVPFGIHTYLHQPCVYVTMLRNPVDRIISLYYYLRRSPHYKALYNQVKTTSLRDYVVSDIDDNEIPYGNNAQTYRISGLTKDTPPSADILEIAKKNLRKHFVAFGLSERFNESLLLMARKFGWKWQNLLYFKRQVATNKPARQEIPQSTRALIEKHSELDMELYQFAKQLFEESVCQQDDSFRDEVRLFEDQLQIFRSKPSVVAYNVALDQAISVNTWLQSKISSVKSVMNFQNS